MTDTDKAKVIDKQKLLDDIQERHQAVMELMPADPSDPTGPYIDGQIYQLERLISDINFGCFDTAALDAERKENARLRRLVRQILLHYTQIRQKEQKEN